MHRSWYRVAVVATLVLAPTSPTRGDDGPAAWTHESPIHSIRVLKPGETPPPGATPVRDSRSVLHTPGMLIFVPSSTRRGLAALPKAQPAPPKFGPSFPNAAGLGGIGGLGGGGLGGGGKLGGGSVYPGGLPVPPVKVLEPAPSRAAGLGGIGGLGGGGSEPERPRSPGMAPEYVGTRVQPSGKADGLSYRLQEVLAAAFEQADPCPPSRTAHYDWFPVYEDCAVYHIGWLGRICDVELWSDGSRTVRIAFTPRIDSNSFPDPYMFDEVVETYRVKDGLFELIDTDAATPHPRLQVFPMAI